MKIEFDKDLLVIRIQELCAAKGMKQTAVFEKAGVGKNFISNLDKANPSFQKLTALANYLGTTVDYLLGNETQEEFARKIMGEVVEWLEDNDYSYEEQDNSTISIGKDGQYVYLSFADFESESLAIKEVSKDGFELAMNDWVRRQFPAMHHNGNVLSNSISESDNSILFISNDANGFTKQELEMIAVYRSLGIAEQADFIQYLLKLKSDKSDK